jgi:hypothetical protein
MKYLYRAGWKRPGVAEVPIVVPLVVGVLVVAATVGVGLLLRKAPEKATEVAKANTVQPTQRTPAIPPVPNPVVSGTPNQPQANLPQANQPNLTPAPQPKPNPPPVKTGPPPNLKVGFNIGDLAPEIEGVDVDGQTFKLSDYRGKVVVLDFWGHW